jgi:phage terminase large subunit-like protein
VREVLARIRDEIARLKAEPMVADDGADSAQHDWYADSCPCGAAPGTCQLHPRARPNQRPPAGDWATWLFLAGRGSGKSRSGAEWVRHQVQTGQARRIALVAATAADVRDVIVEGPAGILAVSPPWFRPKYEPSKRRLTWPNGAIATTFSADEPERLRGPQHDAAWVDELCAWRFPAAWDMLLFGLRLGAKPRVCVTTTPKPSRLIKALLADPTTAVVRGSTYENRTHLAPTFFQQIIARYEGSRLGQQEIHAEILDISEGAWFARFDPVKHMHQDAEYRPGFPVHLAIDCGVSLHVAAVWFQVRPLNPATRLATADRIEAVRTPDGFAVPQTAVWRIPDLGPRRTIAVFGEWHGEGFYSEAAAKAIRAHGDTLPGAGGFPDTVRLDPASSARSGLGPAAYGEFERVFGASVLGRWPQHRVADGLDQVEVLLDTGCLIIHPRCQKLKAAFQNYARAQRAGEWMDFPKETQHPHEDLLDALRGGIRDRFPEGRVEQPHFRTVRA